MGLQLLLLLLVVAGWPVVGSERLAFTRSLYKASIPENSAPKRYVQPTEKMGVHVDSSHLQVRYKIVAGDKERQFKAESRLVGDFWLLLIRTRTESTSTVALNREYEDTYRLRVKGSVHDTLHLRRLPDVHCEVLIEVTDKNDLSPLFFPTWYNVTVPEDTPLHNILVKLNAYDPDLGVNGAIYYRLLEPLRQFAVHPTMGTVLLTRPLDFQKKPTHHLTVVAEDRGPKPRTGSILKSSTAQVVVHVEPVNRHRPAIFVRHVHALVDAPEVWAVVVVTDDDPGIHGTIGGLAIVDGDADDHFTVVAGSQPGEFNLRIDPQRPLNHRSYTLTLRAWDQGVPSQFTDEKVSISPSELNSVVPQLEHSQYEADVPEEAPPGTPLVQIKVRGSMPAIFRIESGNEDSRFVLNTATGRLSTANWLDHEAKANYSLQISVANMAARGTHLKAVATINIRVLDCNDHAPVFDPSPVEILLEENRPVGTKIFTVHAHDEDEAENGYVSYSLVNLNAVPFSVDPFSGEVSTTEVLDYETMRRSYMLRIRATDWGAPYQRQAEMALLVTLRDINDHRPQFEKVDCVVRVLQEAAVGTQVLTLSAVDFDDGGTGRVYYKMDASTDSACFYLNASTGVLSLACRLQRLAHVNVTATDGYHFADVMTVLVRPVDQQASVKCKDAGVIDKLRHQLQLSEQKNAQGNDHGEPTAASFLENRHSPQLSWPGELAVNESTPLGSVLGYIKAKDPDHGYNGRLVYVISNGDQHSCFLVDMHTGALVLVAALDYELAPSHLLNVTAYDQGQPPRSTSQTMFVRVLDVNDNAPLFEKPAYSFVINEDAPNGTSVARLRATDGDQGPNAELHFILMSEQFHIDGGTGLLTVSGPLDREHHDRHLLTVKVTDGALQDPLSSTATVSIVLRDVNDNAPRFARAPYVVRIREDLPVGTLVTSVHAEDADFGENGRVQYSLDDEHAAIFDIDPDTGLVRLAAMLDFEKWRLYNVTVQARDCGDPPFNSAANLIVEVEDVNENLHAPVFAEQVTSTSVDENQPPGTLVTTLAATDEDGVTYTITGGNGLGMFSIDGNGAVRTHVTLDHEACAHYWITVVARDLSPVPLEAFADLHVAVRNLNDQVPLTEHPAYAVTVAEHTAPGAVILTLAAQDKDSPVVDWRLVDDAAGRFAIDRRLGTITSVGPLDREAHERHVLEVVLADEGEPSLSSTTQVLVTLTDINDHKPTFTQPLYRFRVLPGNGQVEAVPLCQVLAVDPDDVHLTYSVVNPGQFSINPVTGLLHTHVQLLHGDTHELMVRASDSGSWPAAARVQLHVVSRPVTVGSAPLVHEVEVSPTLETDPVDHLVAIVRASDPDGDALWYSLAGGNEEGKFMIDCERGFIKLARPLDREACASYNLTVEVTDGSAKATAMVHVEVLDANDNWPVFSESLYQVEVSENTSPGTEILQLTATDADEDQRLFYSIHNSDQVTSTSHFRLDSDTGLLSLALPLDHEASQQHMLTVAVRDSGGPVTRRGFARVLVLVTDHNDHPPEFLQTRYEVRVSETAVSGTALLQLGALDRDRGRNALLSFTVASGNTDSYFSLDYTLGLLTLSRELSRQTQPEFFLTVRAADHGEPPLNATATVHIVVSPVDNAPPHFVPAEQTIEAVENQPAGTFLLALTVRSSSSIFFQLESGGSNHFRLDPVTGVLTTGEEALDYEQAAVHRLAVRATNLAGASALAHVIVQVLDSNDHAPRFLQLLYRGTVSEAAPAGSAVLRGSQPLVVGAQDEDTGVNAQLAFAIVEAWARRLFRIDANTGAVSLVQHLDREQQDEHNFTVEVWDHGQPRLAAQRPATVSIHVSDVNDSPPRFEHELYNTTLLLPTYTGVRVVQVAAHDADLEGPSLRYALVAGDHEGHFEVRPDTGEVVVREPNGLQGLYRLVVSASDGRSETATLVMVSIGRANVGRLRFAQPLWEAAVHENEPIEQRVLLLSLLGAAVGEPVQFSLLTPSDYFAVGAHSGLVRCLAPLDREKQAVHELALEASSARAVAHALLRVRVKDTNDNAPIFVNRPYYSVITVNAQPGDLVLKVEAIDLDEGPNGELLYSLHEGDSQMFHVDERSGEIQLLRTPSRRDEHTLVLVARDHGSPPLESRVGVAVKVTDIAMPTFGQHFYTTSVAEDVAPGTALLTVQAKGAHPLIFSLASDHFAIDRATGVLSLVELLDYESQPRHELEVRATDSVSGAHSEVPVTINVEDVNDCAPLFEQPWYNVSVSEATPVASPLLEVRASDRDGPKLELRLAPDDTFHLEAAGVLRLRAPLDREAQSVHRLQVVASDAGHPAPLSSTARIWVTVIDMNDNPPVFGQPAYTALVDERSRRGQFIARLVAMDPDVSDQLSYAIVAGNEAQLFAIDRSTGVVTVSNVAPAWPPAGFELNISVTDGVYQSYTQLRLVVVASNEHSPRFSQAVYEAVVAENLAPGAPVAHLSATDPDQGSKLTYAIRSRDCAVHFRINSTTGELVTQVPLDHERQHLYEVPVSATDGGGRLAFAVVRVAVTDVNDNEPIFGAAEYEASIWTNTSVGTTLVKVRAFDQDEGTWFRYSLHEAPSNVTAIFNVTHDSGELYLKARVKGGGVFQFFVHVSDQGEPQPLWAVVPVTVAVVPPPEELPSLEVPTRDFFVQEGMPLGSRVLALPPGTTLLGTSEFSIDAEGNLVVAAPLDREHLASHHLTLRKETLRGLATAFDVTVHVLDDNDCEPVFDVLAYKTAVAENAEEGCVVARLVAHDPDLALRKVTYEFYEDTDPVADIFQVDPSSGVVTTLVALDREAVPFYNFTVRVRDDGLLSSSAWVYVEVLDVNDNPPVFEQTRYQVQVSEDAVAGTVIASLHIEDADKEPAPVGFYVLSGDPGQQFAVRSSGDIFVQRPLDREAVQNYTVKVVATDGLHVATTQLDITILDTNDNPPICLKSKYTELVSESIAVGTAILTVEATDADDSTHAQLHFYLSGQGSEDLVLDASSGVLHTARPLDREQRPHYSLVAHVRDVAHWEWHCNSSVELLLSDVNDNPPVFSQSAYEVALPEDTPAGRLVAQVHAMDRDLGPNRRLSYSLVEASAGSHFSVDAHSGLVRLERPLDREECARFNLTVQAQDHGQPPLASRVHLVVTVQDVNDSPPEFTQQAYAAAVSEAAPVGSPISVGVKATSRDLGVNAQITYSLVAGNDLGHFSIEPKTGVLRVARPLDYESMQSYQLAVEARDGGEPPLNARAWLNVSVLDANDNAPVFGGPYSATVAEDASLGHHVLQVQASDADSGGELRYTLLQLAPFALDPGTGQLSVAGPLDREMVSRYVLEVECWDGGTPPLSAQALVHVEVLDINDHPPRFDQSNYTAVVHEGRQAGWTVLHFSLSDADSPVHGPPFRLQLQGGPQGEEPAFFRIEGHELRLARPLPPQSRHDLRVRAYDSGNPPLAAEARVTVLAVEKSRFRPQVQPLNVVICSYLDDFPGGLLGTVHATDEDPYDRISLSLSGPHAALFVLDREDGTLRALPGLDAGSYVLNVSASDGSTPSTHAPVTVHVVAVSEEALKAAVALRLTGTTAARFLAADRRPLLRAVRTALGVRLRDLVLVSVQPAPGEAEQLDVLLAVQLEGGPMPAATAAARLHERHVALEAAAGLRIHILPQGDRCPTLRCVHGECQDRLVLDTGDIVVLAADGHSLVSARHSRQTACVCNPGFGGDACETAVDECAQQSCPAGRHCVPDASPLGHSCQCPPGRTGPQCDAHCQEPTCYEEKRPIYFGGQSYAHYVLSQPLDRRLSFSVMLRTLQPSGTLLYTSGPRDYAILEVSGGYVQYRFDCGSGEGLVRVAGRRVDDGVWHALRLERRGGSAQLVVDTRYEASGAAPGPHDVLNLEGRELHLGGAPAVSGLVGCLDDAQVGGQPLPLHLRPAGHAQLRRLANVQFSCHLVDACGSQPCLNGATCRPLLTTGYTCTCPTHFQGPQCKEPVAEGQCTDGVCEPGNCQPNQCLHGGLCQPDGHCHCLTPYQGNRCELVEACTACESGESCVPLADGFQCGCLGDGSCAFEGLPLAWPLGGAAVLLLFLLLAFACCCRQCCHHRHQRGNHQCSNTVTAKNYGLATTNIRPKISNLEQRPASYTTTREATLNNFDTVRSYGSAADDLESRYQPNDLRCHTRSPSGNAPPKGLYLDKIPNDLKAALSPPLAPQSSATSIASDLPGYCWDYSDLAAHAEEDVSSGDEAPGSHQGSECSEDTALQEERYTCHPDQYLPRHSEPAVCAIEDSDEEVA